MANGRPEIFKTFQKPEFGGLGRPRIAGNHEATRAFEMINTELVRRFGTRGALLERAVTWRDLIAAGLVQAKDANGDYFRPDLSQYPGIEVNEAGAPVASGKWNVSASPLRWNRPASTGLPWTGGSLQTPSGLTGGELIEAQAGGFGFFLFDTGHTSDEALSAIVRPGRVNLQANPLEGRYQCDFQIRASVVREIPSFEPIGLPDLSTDPKSRNGKASIHIAVWIRPARVPDASTYVTLSEIVWSLGRA